MAYNFIDYDAQTLQKEMFAACSESLREQGADDWTLYPGDERYMFLKALVYCDMMLLAKVNRGFLNTTIDGASGEALDMIGATRNCARKEPSKSQVTLKFMLKSAVMKDTTINKGTRVTADKKIFFETKESCTIAKGETEAVVEAECTVGGTESHQYDIGKINSIVDSCPASSVTNLTIPAGGDNGEPYPYDADKHKDGDNGEGDDIYRARIKLAFATASTAGGEKTYEYWAKTANSTISDVRVLSDGEPNVIDLLILCQGEIPCEAIEGGKYVAGVLPNEAILESVLEKCKNIDLRPQGDLVSAYAPEPIEYDIELKYYTLADEEARCAETIEGEGGVLRQYLEWQDSVIGKHINPTKLEAMIVHPKKVKGDEVGAVRVEVVKPEHVDLTGRQVARFSGNLTITHEIVADY